ncbi:hypothetical protein DPMN_045211 [Dreissena polymorpha]|uniref:Uncharacterized protein n=1 Tax=Dreissena polymorpha TaxID=45954 RepID=A0A9D4D7C3_DREPO|nr:hypothetical protein DPMN_045211 [Dreissena polymorpha]
MLQVRNQVVLQTLPGRDQSVDLIGNLLDVILCCRAEERLAEVPDKAKGAFRIFRLRLLVRSSSGMVSIARRLRLSTLV